MNDRESIAPSFLLYHKCYKIRVEIFFKISIFPSKYFKKKKTCIKTTNGLKLL